MLCMLNGLWLLITSENRHLFGCPNRKLDTSHLMCSSEFTISTITKVKFKNSHVRIWGFGRLFWITNPEFLGIYPFKETQGFSNGKVAFDLLLKKKYTSSVHFFLNNFRYTQKSSAIKTLTDNIPYPWKIHMYYAWPW